MNESPDIIMPGVESGIVDLTTGTVTIFVNETVDVTPVEFIDLTKILFVGSGKDLAMTGSTIEAVDDVHFTFQMLEITRVEAF